MSICPGQVAGRLYGQKDCLCRTLECNPALAEAWYNLGEGAGWTAPPGRLTSQAQKHTHTHAFID